MWYAIMNRRVIASGQSYVECSEAAANTGLWDKRPNSVAPYHFTNLAPRDHMPPIQFDEPKQGEFLL